MNRFLPGDTSEVVPATREQAPRSALALVHALLANSLIDPLGLEVWLGEIAQALRARLAGLVALLDNEPVTQHLFTGESQPGAMVSWPWEQNPQLVHELRKSPLAVPMVSADGCSSFLATAVQHEGVLWILCLEDMSSRTWSVDERATLTLAVLAVCRFTSTQKTSENWAQWAARAQTQQRLEDAAALVGRLVHDFNNVFTSVLGFTELSLGQLSPGTPQRDFIAEVYAAAQQGSKLLHQLSLFSSRKTVPPGRTTFFGLLATEEAMRLRKAWGEAISLEVAVPTDLPALSVDADALRLILDKLLDNAREAISATGTVILSARQVELTKEDCLGLLGKACPGPYIEITVVDSGRGFSAEARRRVFAEPFFSTKSQHRGLGLAAVYGILTNYGGGIRLEHGLESGTQVRVYLPTPAGTPGAGAASQTANGERLLVVDDDPTTLHLMCQTLQQAGYRVQPAVDGVQALDSFTTSSEPFQMVLSDVAMPRMTGFDLAQRLLDRDPRIHVLFTSGKVPALRASLAGRTFDVLPKPFRPDSLLRAVRAALKRDNQEALS